jgi:hypothetical protein
VLVSIQIAQRTEEFFRLGFTDLYKDFVPSKSEADKIRSRSLKAQMILSRPVPFGTYRAFWMKVVPGAARLLTDELMVVVGKFSYCAILPLHPSEPRGSKHYRCRFEGYARIESTTPLGMPPAALEYVPKDKMLRVITLY